jgi:AraC-like DNA-binding protein
MQDIISNFTTGALILLFFLFVSNPRQVNILGNRYLSVFLLSMVLTFVNDSFYTTDFYQKYYGWIYTNTLGVFTIGPALYLGVSHYTSLEKKFKKKDLLHFLWILPVLIPEIYFISTYPLQIAFEKLDKFFYYQKLPFSFNYVYLVWMQLAVYWYFSFKKIQKHQKQIKLFTSNTENINLQWLKMFLVGIFIMIFIWVADFVLNKGEATMFITIGHFLVTFGLGYFGLKQEEVFNYKAADLEELQEVVNEIENVAMPEKKQIIAPEELEILKAKLQVTMVAEKLYLDESLSLPKLASFLDISTHKLSHVLNEGFGENFFQFINKYRVEEAKKLLLSGETKQLNMLGIAYNSGFNSKTAFNTAFKKELGMSPTAFLTDNLA